MRAPGADKLRSPTPGARIADLERRVITLQRLLGEATTELTSIRAGLAAASAEPKVTLTARIEAALRSFDTPTRAEEIARALGHSNIASVRSILHRLLNQGKTRLLRGGWLLRERGYE